MTSNRITVQGRDYTLVEHNGQVELRNSRGRRSAIAYTGPTGLVHIGPGPKSWTFKDYGWAARQVKDLL